MRVRDDLRRAFGLARRIVSLSPSATENLFAVGAGDSVVGVTAACDFPTAAKALPKVGDFMRPSYERILALKPDLIVVESATPARKVAGDADKLAQKTRRPVFVQESLKVDDVARHLEQLGSLTGREVKALVARVRRDLRPVRREPPVPVFVEVSATPLYAAGPGSFVDDLIRRAGGRNVVGGKDPFPIVTKEALLAANPKVYVIAGPMHPLAPPLDRFASRTVAIPADLLFRATPRLADGLKALAAALREI